MVASGSEIAHPWGMAAIPIPVRVILLGLLASACTYPTLSPHLAEGTEVLKPGQIGLTVAGGGGVGGFTDSKPSGSVSASSAGGGVEGRVRVGLPGKQELGASAIAGGATGVGGGDPPLLAGGEASYKIAPLPWLAFVVDLGAMDRVISSTAILGGSLAAIFAPYTAKNGTQIYAGVKGSVTAPILKDGSGTAELIDVPVGLALHTSERVRLYVEGGFMLGFGQVDSGGTTTNTSGYGGYGVFAFGYIFR